MRSIERGQAQVSRRHRLLQLGGLLVVLLIVHGVEARVGPVSFTKAFQPDTMGPGSTTELRFDLINTDQVVTVENIAFTDTLPAGVVLATPANPTTDCDDALLSAPDGGATITLSGAQLGTGSSCSVSVFVTSSVLGTHSNTSGPLTSDAGSTPGATADLNVVADVPGVTKSFAVGSLPLGGVTTMTILIDNTDLEAVDNFGFFIFDKFPTGMIIATPSNAGTDCGNPLLPPTLIAYPGNDTVQMTVSGFAPSFPALLAGESCTMTVDVTTETAGVFVNATNDVSNYGSGPSSFGFGVDELVVPLDYLGKTFSDDPVQPGGAVTLDFTITNLERSATATGITFTDDLDAALTGLVATGLPLVDPCGAGSMLTGTSLLTFTGGILEPEQSCSFSVTLQVPAEAAPGAYPNTTSEITSSVWTGGTATDTLVVATFPAFSKSFLVDPVAAGDTTTLEYTITNSDPTSEATDITFFDSLVASFLPFPVSATLPASGFCGAGSSMSLVIRPGTEDEQGLSMTGGSLSPAGSAGDSCTFSVDIDIPTGMAGGVYNSVSDTIVATIDGATVSGKTAADTLTIVAAPRLSKLFVDDPVPPGGTATLTFTLTHDDLAPSDATAVTFTDDLAATMPGLIATGLPMNDLCGPGNGTLSGSVGDTFLQLSGATLTPGQVCEISVTLQVPGDANAGTYLNSTSDVSATVGGVATSGSPARDSLLVTGFLVTKEFIDDPAIPGGTATLRFTLDNSTGAIDANNVKFSDNLNAVVAGLAAPGPLPDTPCGGSLTTLSGGTNLSYSGGGVAGGATCSFDVILDVPSDAADGTVWNSTGNVIAELPSPPSVVLPPAVALLTIDGNPLLLSKSFLDDPAVAGGSVMLELTLSNPSGLAVSNLALTDDLESVLSGLVATGLPVAACNGTLSGTSVISLTDGSLGPGESCTFGATLSIPAVAPAGTYFNTTSQVTGMMSGLPVTGDPASDQLHVQSLSFSMAFDGPALPGGQPVLTFTVENLDSTLGVSGIGFGDDLDAALSGLVAVGTPINDPCGPGSELSGTSIVVLTNGSLPPSGSCSVPVTLQVPPGAVPGSYPNTASNLFVNGLAATVAPGAELMIEPPPSFSKSFSPEVVDSGSTSTLTLTIQNSDSLLAASGLDFTDVLPAGLVVATPPNLSTSCTGGTLTADAGTDVISYSGGTVSASASCAVVVDVASVADGTYVNVTGELTSSNGSGGVAEATLTVGPEIFTDGFESGNTSAWSNTSGGP